jgi:hypothetical protein
MLLALQLQLYTLAVAVAGHRSCVALAAVLPTSSGQRAAAGGRRICTYFNTITTTEKHLLAPCSLSLSLSLDSSASLLRSTLILLLPVLLLRAFAGLWIMEYC